MRDRCGYRAGRQEHSVGHCFRTRKPAFPCGAAALGTHRSRAASMHSPAPSSNLGSLPGATAGESGGERDEGGDWQPTTAGAGNPYMDRKHGLQSNIMARITSDCGSIVLITSGPAVQLVKTKAAGFEMNIEPDGTISGSRRCHILLHPPLPAVGVSIGRQRRCQQNDGAGMSWSQDSPRPTRWPSGVSHGLQLQSLLRILTAAVS